ncbi:MAG: hypothetical protein ACLTSK_06410 [Christensenellales bacterium]
MNRMDGVADDAATAAIKGEGSQSFTASKISASLPLLTMRIQRNLHIP